MLNRLYEDWFKRCYSLFDEWQYHFDFNSIFRLKIHLLDVGLFLVLAFCIGFNSSSVFFTNANKGFCFKFRWNADYGIYLVISCPIFGNALKVRERINLNGIKSFPGGKESKEILLHKQLTIKHQDTITQKKTRH